MSDSCGKIYEFDPQYYKSLIDATIFFSLDPDQNVNLYQREKYKLIENIAKYMFSINEEENTKFGGEIWELSERCIKYFNPDEGIPFLAYFMKAWGKEYKKYQFAYSQNEKLSGIHIPEKIIRKVNTHILRAKKSGIDYLTEEYATEIAKVINWDIFEVELLIQQFEYGTISDCVEADEDELSIIDASISEWENSVESLIFNAEIDDAIKLLDCISDAFNELQERQKKILSMFLTSTVYEPLQSNPSLIEKLKQSSFYNEEIYAKCLKNGSVSQREIAKICGVTEQHVSRSINLFKKRILGA